MWVHDRLGGEPLSALASTVHTIERWNSERKNERLQVFSVGTACSGSDTPVLAFRRLTSFWATTFGWQMTWEHEFSCERDPVAQQFIPAHESPRCLFEKVEDLQHATAHDVLSGFRGWRGSRVHQSGHSRGETASVDIVRGGRSRAQVWNSVQGRVAPNFWPKFHFEPLGQKGTQNFAF